MNKWMSEPTKQTFKQGSKQTNTSKQPFGWASSKQTFGWAINGYKLVVHVMQFLALLCATAQQS